MICCVSVAPRPPYSLGQLIPTHPPACIFLCQSTRRFQSSAVPSLMKSPPSSLLADLGRLALSQPLNSARNASSSALNLKSIDSSGGDSRDSPLLAAPTNGVNRPSRALTLCI